MRGKFAGVIEEFQYRNAMRQKGVCLKFCELMMAVVITFYCSTGNHPGIYSVVILDEGIGIMIEINRICLVFV